MKKNHTQQIDEYHPWGACIAYLIWLSSLILFPALLGAVKATSYAKVVGASTCYVV